MASGIIFDIREFAVHDGPGIRTAVFLKGCPLRCAWCHNPEGLSFQPELVVRKSSCVNCGRCRQACQHEECKPFGLCVKACPHGLIGIAGEKVDSSELAARLKRQEEFLRKNGGGVTITGGEPLAQPEFLISLLKELKPMHTVVETSGYAAQEAFGQVIGLADLILFDIKHTDPVAHQAATGKDNKLILENLALLIRSRKPFIARIPLIPGFNDTEDAMRAVANLLKGAPGLEQVELLPYNPFAGAKYPMMGRQYRPFFDEKKKPMLFTEAFGGYRCRVL